VFSVKLLRLSYSVDGRNKLTWLIFFAPSSSDFALPFFRQYFRFSQASSPNSSQDLKLAAKLGAIGSTTATFLRSERYLQVDAVPAKPTAEQLVASICESDGDEIKVDQRVDSCKSYRHRILTRGDTDHWSECPETMWERCFSVA
jgi:uroporphyrinogen-III synthase